MSIPNLYGSGTGVSQRNQTFSDPSMTVKRFRTAVPFVVTEATAYLTDERVLTAGAGISVVVDAGTPAATVTIASTGVSSGTLTETASTAIVRDSTGGFSAYQPTFIARASPLATLQTLAASSTFAAFTHYDSTPLVSHGFGTFAAGVLTIATAGTYLVSATNYCAADYSLYTAHGLVAGGFPTMPHTFAAATLKFGILAASALTTVGTVTLSANADVGISPNGAGSVAGTFTVSGTGAAHNADATSLAAQVDAAAGKAAFLAMAAGVDMSGLDLGSRTLTAGVYDFSSSVGITGTLTLDGQGNPNAVFIFRIGSTLTTAAGSVVTLINNAQAYNVWWIVGTSATLNGVSTFAGTILAQASISLSGPVSLFTQGTRLIALTGAITFATSGTSLVWAGATAPGSSSDAIRYTQLSGVAGTTNEASSVVVCLPGDTLTVMMAAVAGGVAGYDGANQYGMLQVVKLF